MTFATVVISPGVTVKLVKHPHRRLQRWQIVKRDRNTGKRAVLSYNSLAVALVAMEDRTT